MPSKQFLLWFIYICYIPMITLCANNKDYAHRIVTATINPECPDNICTDDNLVTVVHVAALGTQDCLHYIYDFTGKPSILLALTPINTTFSINWEEFIYNKPQSVVFSTKPNYTSSMTINRIWQFNDVNDTGIFPLDSNDVHKLIGYSTHNITWKRGTFRQPTNEQVEITVEGYNGYYFGKGKIRLNLKTFGNRDHDDNFPHLLHSENSTQFDIVLDNLAMNSTFTSSRFALEMILVANEPKHRYHNKHNHKNVNINNNNKNNNNNNNADNDDDGDDDGLQSFTLHKRKSLDDEHTPGIFELIEIASPESFIGSRGSFVQYRPVAYTHPERDVSTSTDVHISLPTNLNNPADVLNTSLAWIYYGYQLDNIIAQSLNVSFGFSGDGFYGKPKYTTWTFIMSYGAPPDEMLSMFVVIVACIGFGIPLLLILFGGLYICIRRRQRNNR